MTKTAHIISHSHWDREWYMSLEEHRYYLIKLFDDLLEMLREDPEFHSFHLDGQTIMVDDYVAVRPDKREEVEIYLKEGRLIIGPWYILQDAFLTSAEANVRNLLYGMQTTKAYNQKGNLGYFPDTFGIYGQAPQLLKQAKIDTAAFGRGVTPTGFNNQVFHDEFSSPYSEMIWESPDGSNVLAILFANWYSNGNEIPVNKDIQAFWKQKLTDAEKFASTSELLFMNGCDHQPVQKNITEAIKLANDLVPDVHFKHSSFQQYIADVKQNLPHDLQTIKGELRNQKTDGWSTLVNTASARIYLKQANDRCQILLEKLMEPLGCFVEDRELHLDFTAYYWKLLMQNHPHDSICGCSIDEVHQEMEIRFMKVETGVRKYVEEQLKLLAESVNTDHENEGAIPLVVFNTKANKQQRVVTKKLHLHKIYFSEMSFQEIPHVLSDKQAGSFIVKNSEGKETKAVTKSKGVVFGYELPSDGFRRPYYAIEADISFEYHPSVESGYEVCHVIPTDSERIEDPCIYDEAAGTLENEWLKVTINRERGTYQVKNKKSGVIFNELGMYEDAGDIGNEYMFKETADSLRIRSQGPVELIAVADDHLIGSVEFIQHLQVPESAEDYLQEERKLLVWHPNRISKRNARSKKISITTKLTLQKFSKGLQVETTIQNEVKDHRIRALFPTGVVSKTHMADSIYEVTKRSNEPEEEWTNPSFDHHMQRFVSLNGLTIAGIGLHEYEVTSGNTLEITLLRSVGELGDWGVFETPEAQCSGTNSAAYIIIPSDDIEAIREAYQFPIPELITETTQHKGKKPMKSLFEWYGNGLILSSVKESLYEKGKILRWFNPSGKSHQLTVLTEERYGIYRSSIMEELGEFLGYGDCSIKVMPYEILTLRLEKEE